MVERWMKERAAKSFGGPCMSKFVEENERKRILRLKNMKSSISKSSSNKHDNWTQKQVNRRHREIQESKRMDDNDDGFGEEGKSDRSNNDFDLCFRPDVAVSKSGLKLKLTNHGTKPNIDKSKLRKSQDKKTNMGTNNMFSEFYEEDEESCTNRERETKNKRNEEKENQSPKLNDENRKTKKKTPFLKKTLTMSKLTSSSDDTSKKPPSDSRTRNKKKESDKERRDRGMNYSLRSKPIRKPIRDTKQKETFSKSQVKNSLKEARVKSEIPNPRRREKLSSNTAKPRTKNTKNSMVSNSIQQQLHVNRGVTLESLSKEKEEALAILKEIDKFSVKDGSEASTYDHPPLLTTISEVHNVRGVDEKSEDANKNDKKDMEETVNLKNTTNQNSSSVMKEDELRPYCIEAAIPSNHESFTSKGKDSFISSRDLSTDELQNEQTSSTDGIFDTGGEVIDQKLRCDSVHVSMTMSNSSSSSIYSENFETEFVNSISNIETSSTSIQDVIDCNDSSNSSERRNIEYSSDFEHSDGGNRKSYTTSVEQQSKMELKNGYLEEHMTTTNDGNESVDWTPQFKVGSFFVQS